MAGAEVSQSCKRPATRRIIDPENGDRYLCNSCWDDEKNGWLEPSEQLPERILMVRDHLKRPETTLVEAFIEHKLKPFDLGKAKAVYVELKTSKMKVGMFPSVKITVPKRPSGKGARSWKPFYEVSIAVRESLRDFPVSQEVPLRSIQITDEMDRELMGKDWFFEYEEITFNDRADAYAFGAGYGLFKILRAMKLVPGRATKAAQRREGVAWMNEFREWHAAQTSDKDAATFAVAS
jgi:hypothetical protein